MEPAAVPPPRRLIRAQIYQQPPGCHPGQPPGEPPRHWALARNLEVVELVTGGRGWAWIEGGWVEVTPGALLWHVEGDQTIGASDWEAPYRCLSVAFETRRFRGRRAARLSWWRDLEAVEQFCREVLRARGEPGFDGAALFHYAYGRLLFESRLWQQSGPALPAPLREAVEWLEKRYADPGPLRALAARVGWSLPHLHETFRDRLGVTPRQFVLERRIRLAREALVSTADQIKRIAADCGFSGTAAFCHAFKARVGMTPLEYRTHEREWLRRLP